MSFYISTFYVTILTMLVIRIKLKQNENIWDKFDKTKIKNEIEIRINRIKGKEDSFTLKCTI